MNKATLLNELLREFESNTPLKINAVVSRDGPLIASITDYQFNEDSISGLAADITILSDRTIKELLNTTVRKIIIDSEEGSVILIPAGEEAIIFSLIPNKKNLRLVISKLEKLAKNVEKILM
ncbi:MAG: roadblock/LC7 domain-containing protein [Candidatus Hodarchaeota archaeon]